MPSFLDVQESPIGDLVIHSVIYLLILASPEHYDYNDYNDYNDYQCIQIIEVPCANYIDYSDYNDYNTTDRDNEI